MNRFKRTTLMVLAAIAWTSDLDALSGALQRAAAAETQPAEPKPTVRVYPQPRRESFATEWDRQHFSHELWDALLQKHVDDKGLVDYLGMRDDGRYHEYLHRLGNTDPSQLASDLERKAFWINAYNAFAMQAVMIYLPPDGTTWPEFRTTQIKVNTLPYWKGMMFHVGPGWPTLHAIRHEQLRHHAGLPDPRVHLALVRTARGEPTLWNHAYTADKIGEQLAQRTKTFAADPTRCRFDRERKVIHVSKVIERYRKDFTDDAFIPHARSIPAFLADYVEDESLAKSLRTDSWSLQALAYDERLNVQR